MELGLSGLASGMDWHSLVDQLTELERSPQTRMRTEQSKLQQISNAYGSIKTQLSVLQARLEKLEDEDLYDSRNVTVTDSAVASATSQPATPLGTYTFNFTQLASAANLRGTSDIGAALSATNDVSGVVLGDAPFSSALTAGSFTVNGQRITVETTDTLQNLFDDISTATGGTVTASYDAATDKITLSSTSEIVLGSSADTSNFLQVARLYNNGTGTVASSSKLGSIQPAAPLEDGNFATPLSDGGSGAGEFRINGVSIAFSATSDSLQNVIQRINSSQAGVTASYDLINDRLVLTNKKTGDVGVSLEDVTGNFLTATGLTGGTLERGQNLLYTVNGGGQLVSQSNTVTSESSGIAGLSVTALAENSTDVTVAADTTSIRTAINDFVTEYNRLQSMIDTQTASSTDAKGKVTAGVLANENDADTIARQLRSLANGEVGASISTLKRLEAIGIASNGNDNSISISDSEALDEALATNLGAVKSLFSHSTTGLAVRLNDFIEATIGEDGSLITHQETLTEQIAKIDTQVIDQERYVQTVRTQLLNSFLAMEQAQQKSNQQLQFLQSRFGSG